MKLQTAGGKTTDIIRTKIGFKETEIRGETFLFEWCAA